MANASNTQLAPAKYRGFEDGHLTLQQKGNFWCYKITRENNAKKYETTMLKLSRDPEMAKRVYDQYAMFCKNILPAQTAQGAKEAHRTEAASAGKANNLSATTGTPSAGPAKKSPAPLLDQSQNPFCKRTDIIFCVCGTFLPEGNDGYCEDCWVYFTVHATAYEFARQMQLQAPKFNAKPDAQHANITLVETATQGVTQASNSLGVHLPPNTPAAAPDNILLFSPTTSNTGTQSRSTNANATAARKTIPDTRPAHTSAAQYRCPGSNAVTKVAAPSNKISLLTPPPSSSPILSNGTPSQNEVIDLISGPSTPAASMSPSNPATSNASSPKKKSRVFPRNRCEKCKREFPVNLKKNDGMRCTQCCRKEQRAKELEVPVAAAQSLPQTATNKVAAPRKRKVDQVEELEDVVTVPANKMMKITGTADLARLMMQDTVESAVPPEDMSDRELLEYGFTSDWKL